MEMEQKRVTFKVSVIVEVPVGTTDQKVIKQAVEVYNEQELEDLYITERDCPEVDSFIS